MPDDSAGLTPGVTNLLDAVTGNLVTDGLKALARTTSNTSVVRALRKKLGGDVHPVLKDIVHGAMADVLDGLTLPPKLQHDFLRDAANQAAWFQWVVQPEAADLASLNYSYATAYYDRKRLEIFSKRLLQRIKERREQAFPPDTRALLAELASLGDWIEEVALRQTETIVETVEREGDRVVDRVELAETRLGERVSSIVSDLASGPARRLDAPAELAEADALLNAGRPLDARTRAKAALAKLEAAGGGAAGDVADLHRVIADSYLSGQPASEQRKASPHLRELAARTPEPAARHRRLSFAALLDDDPATALKEAELAVGADDSDFKAHTALANAYLAVDRPDDAVHAMRAASERCDEVAPTLAHGEAWVALAAGHPADALSHAERALGHDPDHLGALTVATEAAVALRASALESGSASLDEAASSALRAAEDRATKVISLVGEQKVGALAAAHFNRALFRVWLSRESEAKADLERAAALIPGSKETLRNLVSVSLISDDTDAALRYADEYEAAGGDRADAARARARAHLSAGSPELAVEVIEPFAARGADTEDAREALVLLVEAYDRDLRPEEAERVLSELQAAPDASGFYHLVVAERHRRLGGAALGVDDARAALAAFPNPGPFRARSEMALAAALYDRGEEGNYREAADLYALHASVGVDDLPGRQWALSLLRAGNYPACLRVCREVQAGKRFEVLTDIEASVYMETDNFAIAADRLRWLAKQRPQNIRYALNYGVCLFRLGSPERAYQVMRLVAARAGGSAEALALLSDAYAAVGKYAEAVQFSYEALRLEPSDHRFHRAYISLFMGPRLRGDESIEDRYVQALHKALEEYDERFPKHPFFRRFETTPDDPEAFKAQILSLLDDPGRASVEEAFRTGQFPLAVLARSSGKDVVATWSAATSTPLYGLQTSTGHVDREPEEETTCRGANTLILDPAAALALHSVGALAPVASAFDHVLVPQAFVDDLAHISDLKRRAAEEGELSLLVADGEVYKHEVPAEVVRRYLEFVEGLHATLLGGSKFEVVGRTPGRDETFGAYSYDRQRKALGTASAEALYEARSRRATLLAGDVLTRYVLTASEEVESVGPVAALKVAHERGAMTDDAYHDALLDLIALNYRFIRVTRDMLARAATRARFFCNATSTQALATLTNPGWERESVTGVLVGFLAWLWGEGPDSAASHPASLYTTGGADPVRAEWTWAVLDVLAKRSSVREAALLLAKWRPSVLRADATLGRELEYRGTILDWVERSSRTGSPRATSDLLEPGAD